LFSFLSFSIFDIVGVLVVVGLWYWKRQSNSLKRSLNGEFKGKNVMITGGSSGIGKALALRFSKIGANVIITGRNDETLKKVQEEGKNIKYFALDMEDPEGVDKWCKENSKNVGTLDVIIHNAGLSMRSFVMDTQMSLSQRLLNIDFLSVYAMTQGLMKNMKTTGQGSVI